MIASMPWTDRSLKLCQYCWIVDGDSYSEPSSMKSVSQSPGSGSTPSLRGGLKSFGPAFVEDYRYLLSPKNFFPLPTALRTYTIVTCLRRPTFCWSRVPFVLPSLALLTLGERRNAKTVLSDRDCLIP